MFKKRHKLCTVILEYQNPKMTLETVRSLKEASLPRGFSHQIVVVDNSPVESNRLKSNLRRFNNVKLVNTLKNLGFDYFLLLNNDVIVDPDFLLHLVKAAQKGADLVVPKIYFAKGYEYHKDRYRPQDRGKVIWYAGGDIDWDNVYGVQD